MNCIGCRELLSDHLEGALAPPLEAELGRHLASCRECSELFASLADVVEALRSFRVPEPSSDLTERILAKTLPHLKPAAALTPSRSGFLPSGWPAAASWLAAAAALAAVLVWRPPEILSEWSRETSRTARQVYSFGVRAADDAERWITELNVLRMTVGVAFEDRLDRLTERLRHLEEVRRQRSSDSPDIEDEPDPSSSREPLSDELAVRISVSKRSNV